VQLGELGEFGLIELVTQDIAPGAEVIRGIGDDAAVYRVREGDWQLVTTDTLVEEVHFSLEYTTWRDLGWKALAVNISDIAAMGGRPLYALISLCLPVDSDVVTVQELYTGLGEVAQAFGVSLVGGDTVSGLSVVLSITLIGAVEANRAVFRSGANPGDLIIVTGTLGDSAAGLFLLQNADYDAGSEAKRRLKRAHLRPEPRVEAGRLLSATGGVTAMLDVSDGLSSDIAHIGRASQVDSLLWGENIPLSDALRDLASALGRDPLEWALHGGEDYELLFTVTRGQADRVRDTLAASGIRSAVIGEVTAPGRGNRLEYKGRLETLPQGGFNHFRMSGK
jgi:thiamine-monophosphate kinase